MNDTVEERAAELLELGRKSVQDRARKSEIDKFKNFLKSIGRFYRVFIFQ